MGFPPSTNWCRISSIHSMFNQMPDVFQPALPGAVKHPSRGASDELAESVVTHEILPQLVCAKKESHRIHGAGI